MMLSYLFGAAAVVWIGMLLFVIVVLQRQRRMALEMQEVRRMLADMAPVDRANH